MTSRRDRSAGAWWATCALLLVVMVLVWPARWGGRLSVTVVHGESMAPDYDQGDLVVGWRRTPSPGDVVVYSAAGGLIVHRVVGGGEGSGWVLRGDANGWDDPFRPRGRDVLGVQLVHVPRGRVLGGMLLDPRTGLWVMVLGAGILLWPGSTHRGAGPESRSGRARRSAVALVIVPVLAAVGAGACLEVRGTPDVASATAPTRRCTRSARVVTDLVETGGRLGIGRVTVWLPECGAGSRVRLFAADSAAVPVLIGRGDDSVTAAGTVVLVPDAPLDPAAVRSWQVLVG